MDSRTVTREALAAALRLVPGHLTWEAPDHDECPEPGEDLAAHLARYVMSRLPADPDPLCVYRCTMPVGHAGPHFLPGHTT